MKIAVVGAGAIGGYLGAKLARAGEDVTFIARNRNLAAINANGFRLINEDGSTQHATNVRAVQAMADAGVPDVRVVPADRAAGWVHAANLIEPTWDAPSGVCAVLIELGFVSSPACRPLYTPEALAKVAKAIAAASL